jgi:hypothetical protein
MKSTRLRALQHHSKRAILSEDLRLLLEMGLAVKDGERIGLSPAVRARLEREDHARLRRRSPTAEA